MKTLTIYSTPTCGNCKEAKQYLNSLGIEYQDVDLTQDSNSMSFIRSQGHRTVPQIYLGEQQFVTGLNELKKLSAQEILQKINT